MYDLISIGNIAVDLYFRGDNLTFEDGRFQLAVGGKYFANYFYEGVGGGGANVAIGVKKMGLKSAILGKIGRHDFAKIILEKLNTIGVDTSLIQTEKDYLNISSILLNNEGERTIINFESPHQHIVKNKENLNRLLQAKLIYFGNLPDVSLTEREIIINFLHKNNVEVISNIGVKDCRRVKYQIADYLKNISILIVNGHEFADIIKKNYKDLNFHQNVIENIPFLKEKLVIVTDGKRGSYAYSGNNKYYQEAVKVDRIVDETGCGDGYTAGFISEYLKSKDIEKSMQSGAKYAAKILSQIGAN